METPWCATAAIIATAIAAIGNGVVKLEEQDGKSDHEQDAEEGDYGVPRKEAYETEIQDRVTESETAQTETEVMEEDAEILEVEGEIRKADNEVLEMESVAPEADAEALKADAEAQVEEADVFEAEGEVPEADAEVLQAEAMVLESDAKPLVDEPEVLEKEADEMMTVSTFEVTEPAKAHVVGSENPEVSEGGSVKEDPGVTLADTASVGKEDHGDCKEAADVEPGKKVGDAEAKVPVADDLSEEDEAEVVEEADPKMAREREGGVHKVGVHGVTMAAADTELPEPIIADEVVKAADTTVMDAVDAGEAEGAAVEDVEGGDSADTKLARTADAEIVTTRHTTVADAVNQGEKGEEADAKQPKSAGDSESAVETGAELEEGAGEEMVEVTGDAEVSGSADSKMPKAADAMDA